MNNVHTGEGMTIDEMVDELDMVSGKGGSIGELGKVYLLAAIAAEREACAQIAESKKTDWTDPYCCIPCQEDIAKTIRARATP